MSDIESLRQRAYELAAEPENPPCRLCGEEFADCLCDEYEPRDEHDEADAFDAATERAERRREW